MCACDEQPGGTCSRCRGVTMDDDRHLELELEPADDYELDEQREKDAARRAGPTTR